MVQHYSSSLSDAKMSFSLNSALGSASYMLRSWTHAADLTRFSGRPFCLAGVRLWTSTSTLSENDTSFFNPGLGSLLAALLGLTSLLGLLDLPLGG